MGRTTGIEWTDGTWNPFQGCTKVDADCKFCYMYRDKARYGQDATKLVRSAPPTFRAPLDRKKFPPGSKVFTASWSDWFHPDAAPHLPDAWKIIAQRPDLVFQVLTKRPENIRAQLPKSWGPGWSNTWLGTSVGSPKGAHRAERLAEVEAVVRFLSLEPLWAPGVAEAIRPVVEAGRIDWIILGGESGGAEARPMHPDWAKEVIDLAEANGVAVLFKQWGEWAPISALSEAQIQSCYRSNRRAQPGEDQDDVDEIWGRSPRVDELVLRADGNHLKLGHPDAFRSDVPGWPAMHAFRIGKKAAGRHVDGRLLDGYPTPRVGVAPCL